MGGVQKPGIRLGHEEAARLPALGRLHTINTTPTITSPTFLFVGLHMIHITAFMPDTQVIRHLRLTTPGLHSSQLAPPLPRASSFTSGFSFVTCQHQPGVIASAQACITIDDCSHETAHRCTIPTCFGGTTHHCTITRTGLPFSR